VGYQAVQPASGFVTWDTDAAPQSASFHIRDRWVKGSEKSYNHDFQFKEENYYLCNNKLKEDENTSITI
jgi:hypothetical protein